MTVTLFYSLFSHKIHLCMNFVVFKSIYIMETESKSENGFMDLIIIKL